MYCICIIGNLEHWLRQLRKVCRLGKGVTTDQNMGYEQEYLNSSASYYMDKVPSDNVQLDLATQLLSNSRPADRRYTSVKTKSHKIGLRKCTEGGKMQPSHILLQNTPTLAWSIKDKEAPRKASPEEVALGSSTSSLPLPLSPPSFRF